MRAPNDADRRIARTRAALLATFDRLLLARGYENVSVRRLTADADVGRSTFYEHFEGKDDLLEHSVAPLLAVLAGTAATDVPSDALRDLLTHMRAEHEVAGALLHGPARAVLTRALARELEACLEALDRQCAAAPIAPLQFLAASLAHAQLGTVDAWLGSDDDRCDVYAAARVLHATTRSGVAAMFRSSG